MKKLLGLRVVALFSMVLMIVCGYIKAVGSVIGMGNPFVMMLVVFWGPVLALILVYFIYCVLYRRQ